MNFEIKKLAERVVEDYFNGKLNETGFRVYNETLCPDLWDEQMHLDATIRADLLQLANDFYKKTKFVAPIIDIWLMGSIANFNWTADSDVDIHIVIDFSQLKMPNETASKVAKAAGAGWNSQHNVRVKGHKVEINIHSVKAKKPYIMGIYSLTKDQWIKKPVHFDPSIDKALIQQKYSEVKKYLESTMQSGNFEAMKDAKDFLDEFRQYGLDTVGELSTENIVYKILRTKGYVKGLRDAITSAYDKKMTIPESKKISNSDNDLQVAMSMATNNILKDPENKVYGGGRPDSRKASDAYDINCGLCEEWAEDVRQLYKNITGKDEVEILDPGNLSGNSDDSLMGHVFIRFKGKFYDAETSSGVSQWQNLPLFKKQGTKPDVDEISKKDINAVHPKNVDFYDKENHDWKMNKMTLSNLIALRDKTLRFLNDSRTSDMQDRQELIDKLEFLNTEIKRRLAYINAPVQTESLAPMSDDEVWGDKGIPQWNELSIADLQAMREKAGELWYYAKKIQDLPLIKRALRMSEIITAQLKAKAKTVQAEGYGAGNPEDDPLHIPGERWRIKWDGRKTPKMTKESVKEFVNEFLTGYFEHYND